MDPDRSFPGARRLFYWIQCRLNHQPRLLRLGGKLLRRWPGLAPSGAVIARARAIEGMLRQPQVYLNSAHAHNGVAGEFLINMAFDKRYLDDKKLFRAVLPSPSLLGELSADHAKQRSQLIAPGLRVGFDLVNDYLIWVVHHAMRNAFGSAATTIETGALGLASDEAAQRRYLYELRQVAAQLFAGASSPIDVRQGALACSQSLQQRIDLALPQIEQVWRERLDSPPGDEAALQPAAAATSPPASAAATDFTALLNDRDTVRRTALGLSWVSFPVTVQAACLIVRELLARPAVYLALREQAAALGEQMWSDRAFRATVRDHLVELMRFRPVFPLLPRAVPRPMLFDTGANKLASARAGQSMLAFALAGLFDERVVAQPQTFCPFRPADASGEQANAWRDDSLRYLMFGSGDRACPGKEQAIEILISAMLGILSLAPLTWADTWGRRIGYDGPMVTRMRLKQR